MNRDPGPKLSFLNHFRQVEHFEHLLQHMPKLCVQQASVIRSGCDFTVLLMCVSTVWETLARLHEGRPANPTSVDGRIDSFWDVIELCFTIFFALEVLLKLIVYGWRAYWRDFTNRSAL